MILQLLNAYYERLANDPNSGIARFGFSQQNIALCVTLNKDGSLHEIEDIRTQDGKKLVPKPLVVLGNAKPSGSGINPCFLWDNPAYLLGYKADDPNPDRTQKSFDAFRTRHLESEAAINDAAFSAVCRFLEAWDPAQAQQHEKLKDISTGFGVFRIRGEKQFVHQSDAVQKWWLEQLASQEGESEESVGQCLVTGDRGPIARLHEPKIKGVWGGQSSGASIVSFNLDAFESYGKQQSLNSPVSEQAAFQYCTALNQLLARGSQQRIQIGDASTVFWTEQPTDAETLLPWVFEPSRDAGDDELKNRMHGILSQIAQGKFPDEFGDRQTPFCVLGLSPNAARVSVRFWWVSTLGDLVENLRQHFEDLRIDGGKFTSEWITPWQIIRESVRDSKDIPPLATGALMRSIITGQPYPHMLLTGLIRRLRTDNSLRFTRAAGIKACLNRNTRFGIQSLENEISFSLDTNRKENAYHLGRLFAELERLQSEALPTLNKTIRDRYFGNAAATPALVFPKLLALSQHHFSKLTPPADTKKWKGTTRTFRLMKEDRILHILSSVNDIPLSLSLSEQGLFAIGYYHQRQSMFLKSKQSSTTSTTKEE